MFYFLKQTGIFKRKLRTYKISSCALSVLITNYLSPSLHKSELNKLEILFKSLTIVPKSPLSALTSINSTAFNDVIIGLSSLVAISSLPSFFVPSADIFLGSTPSVVPAFSIICLISPGELLLRQLRFDFSESEFFFFSLMELDFFGIFLILLLLDFVRVSSGSWKANGTFTPGSEVS